MKRLIVLSISLTAISIFTSNPAWANDEEIDGVHRGVISGSDDEPAVVRTKFKKDFTPVPGENAPSKPVEEKASEKPKVATTVFSPVFFFKNFRKDRDGD